MPMRALDRLLKPLDAAKRKVGETNPALLRRLLRKAASQRFADPLSLARFHDILVFLRAFPPDRATLREVEALLASFSRRIAAIKANGGDLSPIEDEEEFSGIAGTTLTGFLNYDETSWLVKRFPGSVAIDWDSYDSPARLAFTLPRFVPLLEEDARVEADVRYRAWLEAASGGCPLDWLVRQIARLPATPQQRVELFAALELPIRWQLGDSPASRTLAKRSVHQVFYHHRPLIQRRDVSLAKELAAPPFRLSKLSSREGKKIIDLCREATTVRYRELYGTSLGDPASVVAADVGRGVEMFLWGLLPERRLPLRAYQAGFTLKNGVPINYVEGIALFEWMEIGFNTFYAYRDGETAWVYAQGLRLLHQVLGVTCISVYPYQLGKDNEEAIQSGAFWFYRKLGFRPMRPELARLTAAEEKKMAAQPSYRTSPTTLRRLAQGHVVFELPDTPRGDWDAFAIRNLGFRVQRRMAERFRGEAQRFRHAARERIAKVLGICPDVWGELEQQAFESYACLLDLVPDLSNWSKSDRVDLVAIIRSKARVGEAAYLALLQGHSPLRRAVLKLGSSDT